MMIKKLMLILLLVVMIIIDAEAREKKVPQNITETKLSGLFLGGQASTNGLGLNLQYIFNEKVSVKTGIETMNIPYSFLFDENDISYNSRFNYKTGGVFFLADLFFIPILYITGGVMLSDFNPKLEGVAVSEFKYGDITIPASHVGGFNISVSPEVKFSPYLGAGLRKITGKNRGLTWNIETGFYYLGRPDFQIETSGLLAPTSDPAFGHEKYLEKQFEAYRYYPMLKFSLAVRLF